MTANFTALASVNSGVFSRSHALDLGETDRTLADGLKAGVIVRLRRGMYASAETYHSLPASGKHLLHARAALAAQKGKVALGGVSAAALHGFDLYQQDLTMVHLLRLDAGASRHAARANHHIDTSEPEGRISVYDGVAAITPARAVWEVVCRSTMVGGVVTADSALRMHPDLTDEIAEYADRFAYFPGSRQGRLSIKFADGRSGSVGESVTRVEFHRHGIPKPSLQFPVLDPRGRTIGISDSCWENYRHLGEFDGKIKYQKFLRPGESPSDRVFREKSREDRMRAGLRGMTRLVWSDVMASNVAQTMADLRSSLEQSRSLYVQGRAIVA